jgi:hypothetical protein
VDLKNSADCDFVNTQTTDEEEVEEEEDSSGSGGGGGNSNAPVYYLCVQHDMSAHVSEAMGWRLRGNYSVTLLWSLCVV